MLVAKKKTSLPPLFLVVREVDVACEKEFLRKIITIMI